MKNFELRFRRFQPGVAAMLLVTVGAARLGAAEETGLSPVVVQQIQSLVAEKRARTPTQLKLDSQLLYAIRMQRGEVVAAGVPTQRLHFAPDATGRVLVDIDATVSPALLAQIRQTGEVIDYVRQYDAIRAKVPLTQLEALAATAGVRWIKPAAAHKTHLGRLTSEGDATHRAGVARTNFAVMGEGVRVGVMSDSVNIRGSLDNSVATGELPPVTVLPQQAGVGNDEGTAMLEIVADLVPKAELFYATAVGGEARFAQNIISLRNAGCDIIVDDIGYISSPVFQDGIVAQAVDAVVANGALYFSAAANSGNKNDGTSCTWEGDFADGGALMLGNSSGRAHTFGTSRRNIITLEPGFFNDTVSLWWSDPVNQSTNDYDLFILDPGGANVVASSTNPQNGNDNPWESADGQQSNEVVIIKVSGADRFLNVQLFRGNGTLQFSTEGNTHGHNCAAGGFGVAAVNAGAVAPSSFGGGNMVETFSSDGFRRMFYDAMGTPYTPSNFLASGGIVRMKPDIAAADGVTTSVQGFRPFFGTSAAAPHAAAIAALIKSYNRALTPDQIRSVLTNTSIDIEAPGPDRDSGTGIVMPGPALTSIPPPLPTLISSNLYGGNGNGVIDPNECNELDLVLKNNAISIATAVSATLVSLTPGVTVVVDTSAYPSLNPGASAVNIIPFRLYTLPGFSCGTPVDLSLRISSSLGNVTNNFRMTSGVIGVPPATVTSTAVTQIPDNDTNGVAIMLPVAGFIGSVGKVTVATHILHDAIGDIRLELISPDGTIVVLADHLGGSNTTYGTSCANPTIFDRMAGTNIVNAFAPYAGAYRSQQSLTAFNGKAGAGVNGSWQFRVVDDGRFFTGSVQCVTITISPAFCTDGGGDCTADLGVTMTDAPDPVLVGSNLLYTIQITNRSPHLAPVTTLLDTLPPGVSVVAVSSTRGSCSASAGSVSCSLGTLPGNGGATVTITVRPGFAGTILNRAVVNSIATETNAIDNTAIVFTTVQNPMPVIVPYATALLSESGPVNGGADPGETLTVNFYLRNVGTLNTTNLSVKMLATGGVKDPSDEQNYGALIPFGGAAARPFTFEVSGASGGAVVATFQLFEGTNGGSASLGTVSFTIGVGGGASLANQSAIDIREFGAASRYPSTVPVSGLAGVISKVTVTLSNLTHSFPEDIDVLLVSPAGQKVLLLSDAGASVDINNVVVKFDDAAAGLVSLPGPIVSGTYRPTDYDVNPPDDELPAPAPAGPYASTLAAFNGYSPNGVWSLYVADDFAGDLGRISGGWHLSITTMDPLNPQAELAVSVSDSPDPVKLGSNVTYTVTVTNTGPEVALAVVLTNLLPSGMSFVSADGAGACGHDAGVVLCDLGIINAGSAAVITIVATATGMGPQDFVASVSGGVSEFNLADNTVTNTTAIEANADLAVSILATPSPASVTNTLTYILSITNRGPNDAGNVTVTNYLPPGVLYVDSGPSQGNCSPSAGLVICELGPMPSGGQAGIIIIVVTPPGVGALTNTATVFAANPPDPNAANSTATLVTQNINPSFIITPAMSFLVSETGPTNGGIDVGETVTVIFELMNQGTQPTVDLVGTLLSSGGVTPLSAAQSYGVVSPGGAAKGAQFAFTASGVPGGILTASIQLQDGSLDLGIASYSFALGNISRVSRTNIAIVPEFGPAALYPSVITVSGLTGVITKVSVTLSNLTHTYPDDLDILLAGPGGRAVMLMSDAGGGNPIDALSLTFDDAASSTLPDRFLIQPGVYRPTDYGVGDSLAAPAPAGPYWAALGAFNGLDANTNWSLFIYDDAFSDQGQLAGGWSLDIATVGPVDPPPALLVAARFAPAGQFEFMLKGQTGGKYLIQRSPDMRNWTTIGNTVLAPSNTLMFTDPAAMGNGPRFYRAVHVP